MTGNNIERYQMNRKSRKRKAFTIVELLVVVLIISMLAAFVAPKLFKNIGQPIIYICANFFQCSGMFLKGIFVIN